MQITTIGLDLAKSVFQVHGVDASGQAVVRKSLRRAQMLPFFAKLPPCLVGIEACGTSHYWARELIKLGHEVRLMPPAYVKPYVKRGKTDAADAEAVCEAVTRPTMRLVPVKSPEQQAALSMHRTRDLLVKQRTQLINMIRGRLAEFGVDIPKGLERALLMRGRSSMAKRLRYRLKLPGSSLRCHSRRSTSMSCSARSIAIWPFIYVATMLRVVS
jgi:transposase